MAAKEKASKSRTSDTVRTLDEHAYGQGEQIFNLFDQGFNAFRDALFDMIPRIRDEFEQMTTEQLGLNKGIVNDFNKQLRSHPWRVVGGVATSALLLGYFMGRANKLPLPSRGSSNSRAKETH